MIFLYSRLCTICALPGKHFVSFLIDFHMKIYIYKITGITSQHEFVLQERNEFEHIIKKDKVNS